MLLCFSNNLIDRTMLTKPVYINKTAATFELTSDGCLLQEPDYKLLIPNAGIRRRMSRIIRMGVATGLQCLEDAVSPVDAILTATGLGCLADTEKFMNTILDHHEELLTPTAFIQSTFNTIGAQIALLTGNHSYNNTYVHRAFSLESALLDAVLLLQEGEASSVLTGAIDEMTPALQSILNRLGVYRKYRPGEGAAFFLLSGQPAGENSIKLRDMELFSGNFTEKEIHERMAAFLRYNEAGGAKVVLPEDYKKYCGEYPTAMSFGLWYTSIRMRESDFPRSVLLYNSFLNNHSFLLIEGV